MLEGGSVGEYGPTRRLGRQHHSQHHHSHSHHHPSPPSTSASHQRQQQVQSSVLVPMPSGSSQMQSSPSSAIGQQQHQAGNSTSPHHGGSSSSNHGHQQQQQQQHRKSLPAKVVRAPHLWKVADEMLGVSIPRKARSGSGTVAGSNGGGGGDAGGNGGETMVHRQASTSPARPGPPAPPPPPPSTTPISPSSSTASVRKKTKLLSGCESGKKLRPPKNSNPPSSVQDIEFEVAGVLFGMTRQFPSNPETTTNKAENGTCNDAKSRVSSPNPVSQSGAAVAAAPAAASTPTIPSSPALPRPPNSNSTSGPAVVPRKRKRPRPVKMEDDSASSQSIPSTAAVAPASRTTSTSKPDVEKTSPFELLPPPASSRAGAASHAQQQQQQALSSINHQTQISFGLNSLKLPIASGQQIVVGGDGGPGGGNPSTVAVPVGSPQTTSLMNNSKSNAAGSPRSSSSSMKTGPSSSKVSQQMQQQAVASKSSPSSSTPGNNQNAPHPPIEPLPIDHSYLMDFFHGFTPSPSPISFSYSTPSPSPSEAAPLSDAEDSYFLHSTPSPSPTSLSHSTPLRPPSQAAPLDNGTFFPPDLRAALQPQISKLMEVISSHALREMIVQFAPKSQQPDSAATVSEALQTLQRIFVQMQELSVKLPTIIEGLDSFQKFLSPHHNNLAALIKVENEILAELNALKATFDARLIALEDSNKRLHHELQDISHLVSSLPSKLHYPSTEDIVKALQLSFKDNVKQAYHKGVCDGEARALLL